MGGPARKLALDINAVIIGNDVPETEAAAGVDAWQRLAEIKVPVTVACGDLYVPFLVDRCRLLADRLPAARHHVLAGMTHQPYLESAGTVAQLIRARPLRRHRGRALGKARPEGPVSRSAEAPGLLSAPAGAGQRTSSPAAAGRFSAVGAAAPSICLFRPSVGDRSVSLSRLSEIVK